MKLRDLFRWRADVPERPMPDPPMPAPARPLDWPTMRPLQRVVSSPDLITTPDRFPDSLLSWRNPSRSSNLGHYVTPDAPAGVSDGFATASPRGELPAPAQPRWWPRPPTVQRRVSTSRPAPEPAPARTDNSAPAPPPAVPVYPLTEQTLVSAADVEPPPRWALAAVQRQAAEPETSQPPVADFDLPAGESPPEAPLPPATATTEPLLEASAGSTVSWPGGRPELPAARRRGLGAPLQRVPDAEGGPAADAAPVQRRVDADVEPMGVAPLVSNSPMASMEAPPMPSGAVDTPTEPGDGPVWSAAAWSGSTNPTAATPLPAAAGPGVAGPSTVQRQIDVEPMDVAPLVSDSPPVSAVDESPMPSGANGEVDTSLGPNTDVMSSPSAQPTAATPLPAAATPTAAGPSTVQRQVEADSQPAEVAPLVSDSSPMAASPMLSGPVAVTSAATPMAGPRSTGPSPLPASAQRAVDAHLHPGLRPARLTSPEATAAAPARVEPPHDGVTVQRRAEAGVQSLDVAPLVSDSAPMAAGGPSPLPGSPAQSTEEGLAVQRAVDTSGQSAPPVGLPLGPTAAMPLPAAEIPQGGGESTVQHRAEGVVEAMDVAPLVSDFPPMTSVDVPSAATPSTKPTHPIQRAVDIPLQPGSPPVGLLLTGPTAAPPSRAAEASVGGGPSPVQRRLADGVESLSVAPLVSDSALMASVVTPAVEPVAGTHSAGPCPSAGSSTWPGAAGPPTQRAVDSPLGPRPVQLFSSEPAAVTPSPTAQVRAGGESSTVQREAEGNGAVESREVAPLVSDSAPMSPLASVVMPSTVTPAVTPGVPGLPAQRAVDTAPQPRPMGSFEPTDMTLPRPTAAAAAAAAEPSVQRLVEVADAAEPVELAPLVSDSPPMASVVIPSAVTPTVEPVAGPHPTGPSPSTGSSTWSSVPGSPVQRAVDTALQPRPVGSFEPTEMTLPRPTAAAAEPFVQRRVEVADAVRPEELAPLVSDSPPMASVATPASVTPTVEPVAGAHYTESSRSTGSSTWPSVPGLPLQRAVGTLLQQESTSQRESTDISTPTIAASAPLSDVDHTGDRPTKTYDSVPPAVVGLVGDRPIEPVTADHAAAVASVGVDDTAPAAELARRPTVQRHPNVEDRVMGAHLAAPSMPTTTAAQRRVGTGAESGRRWAPEALPLSRSSPGVDEQVSQTQPVEFVQFTTAAAPVAFESDPPQWSTEPAVQRAADEPAATAAPATATSPPSAAGAATPAQPAGSTSPTEMDKLVRRLYDPIVRRLKAELQLDRERAGRSLDLWH